jgi:hypothetical protein
VRVGVNQSGQEKEAPEIDDAGAVRNPDVRARRCDPRAFDERQQDSE